LECCLLAEEIGQLLVLLAALGDAVLILREQLFDCAAALLVKQRVDLSLGDTVLISVEVVSVLYLVTFTRK
jgi:hypothetical protein